MLITPPQIWLKTTRQNSLPASTALLLLTRFVFLHCCWLHHRSNVATGTSFIPVIHSVRYVFAWLCLCRKAKAKAKPSRFSIMHPHEMWNLANKVCSVNLISDRVSRCIRGLRVYMGPETHLSWNVWNHCWVNFKLFLLEFDLTFMPKG